MKKLEEQLKLKKLDIDNLKAPVELEERLRGALKLVQKSSNKYSFFLGHKVIAAAILLLLIISGLNYDVFAYYGKKILGYDKVTAGSLKDLNEMGRGQEINKSYKFKDGTEFIVDGIMFDANKLTMMYRIKGDSEDKLSGISILSLKGMFKSYNYTGGIGTTSEDKKEITWLMDFDPPSIFNRNVTLSFYSTLKDSSQGEIGKISFKIDMNKAIKRVVKSNINKVVESQGIKYKFTTLSASPMSVLIDGTIEVGTQKDKQLFDNSNSSMGGIYREVNVELLESYLKEGKVITESIKSSGGNMGSNGDNIKFEDNFDGLKPNLKSLTLNVLSTDDTKYIDKKIDISKATINEKVVPNTEELIVKDVKVEDGNTIVTFIGDEDVIFDTALFIGETQAKELESTSQIIESKGIKALEKTYKFEGTGDTMQLMFKTISHRTMINKPIVLYNQK